MLKKKLYNVISKVIHLFTPIMFLLSSIVGLLTYNKVDDPGGWGGLGLFTCVMISIIWLLVSFFIGLIKKETSTNNVIKIILSITNLIIFYNNMNLLIDNNINELILALNTILVMIYPILLIFYSKFIFFGHKQSPKKNILTVDWVFIIGIILIAIVGGIIDGVYSEIANVELLPHYTLKFGVVSYTYWIILLIYSAYKYENKIEKPKYVRFYWFFILWLFHIVIAMLIGTKLSGIIINIFNLI